MFGNNPQKLTLFRPVSTLVMRIRDLYKKFLNSISFKMHQLKAPCRELLYTKTLEPCLHASMAGAQHEQRATIIHEKGQKEKVCFLHS